jgi:hypothetical protein
MADEDEDEDEGNELIDKQLPFRFRYSRVNRYSRQKWTSDGLIWYNIQIISIDRIRR